MLQAKMYHSKIKGETRMKLLINVFKYIFAISVIVIIGYLSYTQDVELTAFIRDICIITLIFVIIIGIIFSDNKKKGEKND